MNRHGRRRVGLALVVVGLTGVLVAAVAYDASGLRADFARCERRPDSLEMMGCGLTRLSAGMGMLGLAILIVLLLALGGWLIAGRSSDYPRALR